MLALTSLNLPLTQVSSNFQRERARKRKQHSNNKKKWKKDA
jgi:hypothetical protein